MKKLIFTVLIALVTATTASAQFSKENLTYGAKMGINAASIAGMDIDSKMKFSFHAGAWAEYRFSPLLGVSPELLYSRQGYRFKNSEITQHMRMNYLNVPLLVKIYPFPELPLSFEVGPQLGFLLNAKSWEKWDDQTATNPVDGMKGFDFSVAVGATYWLGDISVQARFTIGLTSVADTGGEGSFRNNVLQLGAGYRF